MLRARKDESIQQLRDLLSRSAGALFVDYTGLTVAESDRLRGSLRGSDMGFQVVKNSLMARAVADSDFAPALAFLKGTPTGMVWGRSDPVAVARVVFDFQRECEQLRVKGAVVESRGLGPAEARALSQMPGRRELQAAIVAQALAPAQRVLGAVGSGGQRAAGIVAALVKRLEAA